MIEDESPMREEELLERGLRRENRILKLQLENRKLRQELGIQTDNPTDSENTEEM